MSVQLMFSDTNIHRMAESCYSACTTACPETATHAHTRTRIYPHVHAHTHTQTYKHVLSHTRPLSHTHPNRHTYIHTYTHRSTHTGLHTHTHTRDRARTQSRHYRCEPQGYVTSAAHKKNWQPLCSLWRRPQYGNVMLDCVWLYVRVWECSHTHTHTNIDARAHVPV